MLVSVTAPIKLKSSSAIASTEQINMVQKRSGLANLFFAMINHTKNVDKAKPPNRGKLIYNVVSTTQYARRGIQ